MATSIKINGVDRTVDVDGDTPLLGCSVPRDESSSGFETHGNT
jgi:hypothetical protein